MADLMIESSDIPDWSWKAWNAIEELLSLSYWTRIWIVQEFVLARRVTIHCGSHSIEWKTFEGALSHILQFKVDNYPETRFVHGNFSFINNSPGVKVLKMRTRGKRIRTLLELLEACKSSQCYDRRDKVYALLGLAKDVPNSAIVVDYNMLPFKVAMDVLHFFPRPSEFKFCRFVIHKFFAVGDVMRLVEE